MTAEEQRATIAEHCGFEWWEWKDATHQPFYQIVNSKQNWMERQGGKRCSRPSGNLDLSGTPDYLQDLNAMCEAERKLKPREMDEYLTWINPVSSAEERAVAFLRVVGKRRETLRPNSEAHQQPRK